MSNLYLSIFPKKIGVITLITQMLRDYSWCRQGSRSKGVLRAGGELPYYVVH